MGTNRGIDDSDRIDFARLPGFDEESEPAGAEVPDALPRVLAYRTEEPSGFSAIGGMDEAKTEIRLALIEPLLDPEMAGHYGMRPGARVLLWGPPGCGKTIFAQATAEEVPEATFLPIKIADILGPHVGEDERNLADVFRQANEASPSVLFFDEVDALSPRRNDPHVWEVERRLTNSFLQELDGSATSRDTVAVIGATNQPWLMDSAILRPGRFDRLIYVGLPDFDARKRIWDLVLDNLPLGPGVCVTTLAKLSNGLTGAEIAGISRSVRGIAFMEARARKSVVDVRMLDILLVLRNTHPRSSEWLAEVPAEFARAEKRVLEDCVALSTNAQRERAEAIECTIDEWATGELSEWEEDFEMPVVGISVTRTEEEKE